jgi:outer membrane immunogenic protein
MKKVSLFMACSAFAWADAAVAADNALPAYKAPPAPAAFSWTGIYIGGHGGWAFQETTFDDPFGAIFVPGPSIRSVDFRGFFGGQQAGWNYQIGNLVVGNEIEVSWASLNGSRTDFVSGSAPGFPGGSDTRTIMAKTDWFGTATARLGFAWDRVLFYTKGGAAWARFNYEIDDLNIIFPFLPGGATTTTATSFTGKDTRIGWTVGAGLEWAFWQNLSAKVEYDYLAFVNKPVALTSTGGTIQLVDNVEHSIQIVKVGLNWHLKTGDAPSR